jgi:glycosyltransferase involved in cell wall biosynthesis
LAAEPIRVMRIITRLNIGGPSYQAIYLTERLQDKEFESRLVVGSTSAAEGNMESMARERGVELIRIPGLGREISVKTDGMTVHRLYKEIRRYRPHIVHTHMAKAGAVGRLAAKLAKVPAIVHTYHGHVFHGYFSPRKTKAFLKVERTLARWTDRIIVLSDGQKAEILGYGVGRAEQMTEIPLGLELNAFLCASQPRGQIRRELNIPADAKTVGIVARLVPIKAHELFLNAAKIVCERVPNAHFLIVGDGERRDELERCARAFGLQVRSYDRGEVHTNYSASGKSGMVHFLGFRSDLVEIYTDLDVVVVCSHNEGMPVTIIEALSAARPVVATDVGAVRSLIIDGETGILVPPMCASALGDAIVNQLLNAAGAAAMAQCGRQHVYPRLSIERLERDIRRLYYDLMADKLPSNLQSGVDTR